MIEIEEKMSKQTCLKHGADLMFVCTNCQVLICSECVDEHNSQNHSIISLLKYTDKTMLPDIHNQIKELLQSQPREEQKNAYEPLVAILNAAIERAQSYLSKLTQALHSLTRPGVQVGPVSQLQTIQSRLTEALQNKNTQEIARQYLAYEEFKELSKSGETVEKAISTLQDQFAHITTAWNSEDQYLADVEKFLRRISTQSEACAIVHNFKYNDWGALHLWNPLNQKYTRQALEVPATSTGYWISTATIKNKIYFSGGYMNSQTLKATYEITVKPDLTITQRRLADMQVGKAGHALVSFQDTSLLSLGGFKDDNLKDCERYTLATNVWSGMPNLNFARFSPAACIVNNSWVYCIGGDPILESQWIERMQADVKDLKWAVVSVKMTTAYTANVYGGRAVQVRDSTILVFGGDHSNNLSVLFDINKGTIVGSAQMAAAESSFSHSCPVVCGDNIYVVGMLSQHLHCYSITSGLWSARTHSDWMLVSH